MDRSTQLQGTTQAAPDAVAAVGSAGGPAPGGASASQIVAQAVRRAAVARVATLGPHLIALVVKASSGVTLPATATTHDPQLLADRLRHRAPLTPLADPEVGQDHLGAWGERPSSVGDLLAARGTEGQRVVGELERQCALEAARMAPRLADELAREHPQLAGELGRQHAAALVGEGRPLAPAAVLCSEVAALLAIELVTVVADQLAAVPVSPLDPSRAT
jgi:hypothetical protein